MIALLTDFGYGDGAVASMKGVIKGINPDVDLVDISHDIASFSIREGAFILNRCYRYFPQGTIFLNVVDPGVGSNRMPILLQTNDYYFISPDNGLLTYIINQTDSWKAYSLSNPKFQLSSISNTFHGRDIFAPASAYLSLGFEPQTFGDRLSNLITFEIQSVQLLNENSIQGEIIFVDHFGNAVSNILKEDYNSYFENQYYQIWINNINIDDKFRLVKYYSKANKNEFILYFGSMNFLEMGLSQGSLQDKLKIQLEDKIRINPIF